MKLRCASVKEAEDWKEALEAESAVIVDSSPAPEESSATEVLNYYSFLIQCQNDYQLDKLQTFFGPTGFSVFSFYNSSSVFFFFIIVQRIETLFFAFAKELKRQRSNHE